ncbi:hypothetical protein GCM10027168_22100 [Streptomyces capparidis]
MSRFPVVRTAADGGTVVELSGEIDLDAVPRLTRCLDEVTEGPCPRVVVDLRQVTFIDCRGLSVLVRARLRVRERHGALALVAADRRVLHTFRAAGLLGSFSIHPELPRALAAVRPPVPHSA